MLEWIIRNVFVFTGLDLFDENGQIWLSSIVVVATACSISQACFNDWYRGGTMHDLALVVPVALIFEQRKLHNHKFVCTVRMKKNVKTKKTTSCIPHYFTIKVRK